MRAGTGGEIIALEATELAALAAEERAVLECLPPPPPLLLIEDMAELMVEESWAATRALRRPTRA